MEVKGKLWQAQNLTSYTAFNGLTTVTTFLFTVCPTEALWTAAVVTRQQILEVVMEEVGTKIKPKAKEIKQSQEYLLEASWQ